MSKRLLLKSNSQLSQFPVVQYQGQNIKNLTAKIWMFDYYRNNLSLFFTYTLNPNELRPDVTSRNYYGDPQFDWVILLVNQVADPFFDWPVSQVVFEQMVVDRYGSLAAAQSEILFYQQKTSMSNISVQQFSILPSEAQKYWQPIFDYDGNIIQYKFVNKGFEISVGGYNLFSPTEQSYWEAVTQYDEMFIQNENNRVIRLLDRRYLNTFIDVYNSALAGTNN